VNRNQIALDWVGLNHLNWIRGATLDGEDIWPQVFEQELEEARQNPTDGWNFPAELLEQLGMIPCGYLNYYYNRDSMYQELKTAPRSRGEEVREIEEQLLRMYQDPELKEKPALLEKRGGAYYSKAAVSLIAAIANDKKETHIVNTANEGTLPGLGRQDVVEVPSQIGAQGARPHLVEAMPPEIRGLVQAVKAYEQLAAKAGAEGDWQAALQAMLAHPLVPSFQVARDLLQALLQAHRAHLPQFFPEDNQAPS
jgi:6-phospho-beta-glucosidase